MLIVERMPGDGVELRLRVAAERNALRRDRYRAVLLAIEGQEATHIAASLGRARRSVQDWAYAYRDGGVDAIQSKPRAGRAPKLSPDREAQFKARLDAGPTPEDGVCTLRGKDVVRILEAEFGVKHTLGSIYGVLRRVGYSCLSPRPRHEKNDKAGIAAFKEQAPFFVRIIADALKPHGGKVRVFIMDEARIGQQGTLTRVWAPTGSRPTAVKQTRYEWVYLYAAVEPLTGESVALLAPNVNTDTFNVFLTMLAAEVRRNEHVVLIMDQAGWHRSRSLALPECLRVLLLPPYSPELNPVENLWHHLRSRHLSNRAYADYDDLIDAGTAAWRRLTPAVIKSVCRCPYLERAQQS